MVPGGAGAAHRPSRGRAGGHGRAARSGVEPAGRVRRAPGEAGPAGGGVQEHRRLPHRSRDRASPRRPRSSTRSRRVRRAVAAGSAAAPGREAAHRRHALGRAARGRGDAHAGAVSHRVRRSRPRSPPGQSPAPAPAVRGHRAARAARGVPALPTRTSARPATWPACTRAPTSTWGSPCPMRACTRCGRRCTRPCTWRPSPRCCSPPTRSARPRRSGWPRAGDGGCSGQVLEATAADGDLSADEAEWAASRILFDNAAELYGRGAPG